MRPLRLSQTADAGLRFAGVNAGVTTGANPVRLTVWDRMHALDAKAQSLDKNLQAYVRDPNLKQRYSEWFTAWRSLYDALAAPNQRPNLSQSRQAELESLVGDHEREFESLLQSYNSLGATQAIPSVTYAPIVVRANPEPAKKGLPWWFWVGGGVLVFGVGYVVYRKYQEGRAKAAFVHKQAPGLLERYLPGYGGTAYAYTQAGRDPDSAKIPPEHDPLRLDYYARPAPQGDPSVLACFAERTSTRSEFGYGLKPRRGTGRESWYVRSRGRERLPPVARLLPLRLSAQPRLRSPFRRIPFRKRRVWPHSQLS